MNKYKELAGQTLIYGLGTIVPRLLNYLLLTPFYTYIFLDQAKYGVITELYSYTAFLLVFLTYGMETTFFKFSSTHDKKSIFNNTLSLLFITSFIFILLAFLSYKEVATALEYPDQSYLIIIFCSIVFFDVITSIPFALLRNEGRAIYFSLIKIGSISLNIFFNIFFLVICRNSTDPFWHGLYNPEIGVGYAFISNLIASTSVFFALIPVYLKFTFTINWKLCKQLFAYALPLLVVGIAGMINEVADKLFLRHLLSDEENPLKVVGIYGANYKMAVLMTIFIQMFKYAAEPFFFKNANNVDAKNIYKNVMEYFIIFCLFIFLLVTLYIDLFKLFIGPNYREGLAIVPIVLFANLFLGIYYNLSVWYKINNLTRFGAYISIFGVIITIIINLVFIPQYSYFASAWATLFCFFVMTITSYFLGQKYYPIKYNILKISLYFGLALSLYFVSCVITFSSNTIQHLFSTLLMIIYIVGIMKLNAISFRDIKNFKQLLK